MKSIEKLLFIFCSVVFLAGCTYDKYELAEKVSYPKEVADIIINKCATAGCHNTQSAGNAGGLDYSTWDKMFEGGRNGNSVIPYSTAYSYMLYFVNSYTDLGISLEPRMPFNQPPLSRDEVLTLRNWIANGAPNSDGFVKFSDDGDRKKFYVCMQGCDQVAVFDSKTRAIMRYIKVGVDDSVIESPHDIAITPDGKYWAMAFINGHIVQFYNTTDDKLAATVDIGIGSWNILEFSPDSRKAFVSSTQISTGRIAEIDIPAFTHTRDIPFSADSPHGMHVSNDGNILYVTAQSSNYIRKIYLGDLSYDDVSLGGGSGPHQIEFAPNDSTYYVSCVSTNEVRVFNAFTDQLITAIPVGTSPLEMELSERDPFLYVTCISDVISPTEKGSVYVINYITNQVVTHLYTGYQPHGIDVDDEHQKVYVANLNYDVAGPPPHHITDCGGKNGYITIIDMNTLQLLNVNLPDGSSYVYKNEVLPSPYEIAVRK